jgi:hypothetical protein
MSRSRSFGVNVLAFLSTMMYRGKVLRRVEGVVKTKVDVEREYSARQFPRARDEIGVHVQHREGIAGAEERRDDVGGQLAGLQVRLQPHHVGYEGRLGRVLLQRGPELQVPAGQIPVLHHVPGIALSEDALLRDVGGSGPHLERRAVGRAVHQELVVGNLGSRPPCLHEARDAGVPDRFLVVVPVLLAVHHQHHLDASVPCGLQQLQRARFVELVERPVEVLVLLRALDVRLQPFEEPP